MKKQRTEKTKYVRERKRTYVRSKNKNSRLYDKSTRRVAKAVQVVANVPFDGRGLSQRDAVFVSNVLKGMGKTEAMKLAASAIGVELTDRSAGELGSKAMQNPKVDSAIVSALRDAGIDDELIARKMKEGLDATAFTQTGIEHDDFKTRHLYIRTILQVKGQIGADVSNQTQVLNYTTFKEEE